MTATTGTPQVAGDGTSSPADAPTRTPAATGRTSLMRSAAPIAALGCGLAFAVVLPWLVNAYLISLATTALTMTLLAWSTQLLAHAGLPSLGQAAYLGVGAYTAATITTATGPVQLIAATAAGAITAAITGLLALRARDTTFLMATFAIGELGHAAANQWAPGGSEGIHTPPVRPLPALPAMILDGHTYLYTLAVVAVLATALTLLHKTRFTLALRAIATHEPRAQACGHHTNRLLWTAYTIAGAIAAAAGSLIVAGHQYVTPADLGFDTSALALAAATIGRTSLAGTAAAALALVTARDWAGGILGGYGTTLLGVLLLVVAFLPHHRSPSRVGLLRRRP